MSQHLRWANNVYMQSEHEWIVGACVSIHVHGSVLLPVFFWANSRFGNHLTSVTSCYVSHSWRDRGGDRERQSGRLRQKERYSWGAELRGKPLRKIFFIFFFLSLSACNFLHTETRCSSAHLSQHFLFPRAEGAGLAF